MSDTTKFIHRSIWEATGVAAKTFGKISGNHTADVVIVGGGISGLTCAYLLGKAGKKVILLESFAVGASTTGNSTGNLYSLVEGGLSSLKSKWGNDTAKRVVNARAGAINLIGSIQVENKIECNFERVNFNYFAEEINERVRRKMDDELKAAGELGVTAREIKSVALPFATAGAVEIPGQAQFHPLNYARGLAAKMPASVTIYENSAVIDFDPKAKTVTCEGASIRGAQLIFATHTPKGVSQLHFRMEPIREHGIAAELRGELFKGTFWRLDEPKRSIRTLGIGGKNYAMVIGEHFKTGHKSNTVEENDVLNEFMQNKLSVAPERYWWAAQSYRGADGLPFIGEQADGCYTLTGFATDGLVYGTLGASIISNLILGKSDERAELFATGRFTPLKSASKIIKEGADNFCQYLSDLPKVGTGSPDELQMGEGAVVERAGEKLAVYKDDQNKLHVVSAVCPHMKCIVKFNNAERTWDCPCHASRFGVDGKVLEGPALSALEKKTL